MSETEKILQRYELISGYSTGSILRPLCLGNFENRICRLCGKTKPEVTFKKKSHIVPEGLGNKILFSLYECDNCNSLYGSTIENDLNNLLSPYKLFFKIKGKKGINTIKPYKGKDRIEYAQDLNMVLAKLSNENISIDHKNKTAKLITKTQPFSLFNIYKCLLKIALLILPENEFYNFTPSLQLLKNDIITSDPLYVKISNTHPYGIEHIEIYLYRRKSESVTNPYVVFILIFRTLIFQVNLHINFIDHNVERTPIFFDSNFRTGSYSDEQIFNCNDKTNTRSTFTFNFKYEGSRKLPEELKVRINRN